VGDIPESINKIGAYVLTIGIIIIILEYARISFIFIVTTDQALESAGVSLRSIEPIGTERKVAIRLIIEKTINTNARP